jgi:hypothetical protein
MAGRVGFEPTEAFRPLSISSRAPLATQSSTHICEPHICEPDICEIGLCQI